MRRIDTDRQEVEGLILNKHCFTFTAIRDHPLPSPQSAFPFLVFPLSTMQGMA